MAETTTHTGVFDGFRWREIDGDFIIGYLECGTIVKGRAEDGELTPGITYQFHGSWAEDDYGRYFKFKQFLLKQPHSREGVVAYLERYAPGVGPAVASRIWDAFGSDSVSVLRTQPEAVLAVPAIARFYTAEKAQQASKALRSIAKLEDTKIQLTNLFHGRGFPGVLVDECITKWGIMAPAIIKRDPYRMLAYEMSGCGFARCDRLYIDLGLAPEKLKRQVVCLWHVLHSDSSGSTWIAAEVALAMLGERVSGAKLQRRKAIQIGCRSGWLAKRRDAAGVLWLAEGDKARAEARMAEKLIELSRWTAGDPCFAGVVSNMPTE